LTTTTVVSPQSPTLQHSSSSSSAPTPSPSRAATTPSWIVDSFVFDEYNRKVRQVSQFVMESKFLEAIRKLVEYGNREFLRSFQLRSEIKECNNSNGNSNSINNNDNKIITTDVASLIPPFETIGFLESKWLEVLKGLVEYGNNKFIIIIITCCNYYQYCYCSE
jgi:hypothetical protein